MVQANHDFLHHRGADASRCRSVLLGDTTYGSADVYAGEKRISYLREASVFRKLTVELISCDFGNVAVVETGASRETRDADWMSSAFRTSKSLADTLSGGSAAGEIARSLVISPKFILLDERSPVSTPLLSLKYKKSLRI